MEETSETLPMYTLLQGGGLYIYNADVTMTDCNIYENTATYVSACFLNLPRFFPHCPHGVNFQEMSSPLFTTDLCVCALRFVPVCIYGYSM